MDESPKTTLLQRAEQLPQSSHEETEERQTEHTQMLEKQLWACEVGLTWRMGRRKGQDVGPMKGEMFEKGKNYISIFSFYVMVPLV